MSSFEYKSCGTNGEGDHYCARDYGPDAANSNSYHYSNADGSYYYSNPDVSTYFNNGRGDASYSPPDNGNNGGNSGGNSGDNGGMTSRDSSE